MQEKCLLLFLLCCLTTVDCKWRFIDCGPCSATCGDDTQTCTPKITIEAENGGKECPEFVRSGKPQEKKCEGLKPCPGRRTNSVVSKPITWCLQLKLVSPSPIIALTYRLPQWMCLYNF